MVDKSFSILFYQNLKTTREHSAQVCTVADLACPISKKPDGDSKPSYIEKVVCTQLKSALVISFDYMHFVWIGKAFRST